MISNFNFCRIDFDRVLIEFYFFISEVERLGGTRKLEIIKYAGDFEPANRDLILELVEHGTRKDMLLVNAATRYWAACEAVFRLNHPIRQTRDRFDLVATTMLVDPGRMLHFAGYLPSEWQIMQRCYSAAIAEACYSNWDIEYDPED